MKKNIRSNNKTIAYDFVGIATPWQSLLKAYPKPTFHFSKNCRKEAGYKGAVLNIGLLMGRR